MEQQPQNRCKRSRRSQPSEDVYHRDRDDVAGSEFIDDSAGSSRSVARDRREGLDSFGYRSGDGNDRNYDRGCQDAGSRNEFGGQFGTQQSGQGQNRRYSGEAGQYGHDRRDEPAGPHAGKGPKGYLRSDERIREDVCEALSRHSQIDASEIEVTVENGVVTLAGSVTERQLKRVAEDCVEIVSGVRDIINTIRIAQDGNATAPGPSRSDV